MYGSAAMTSPNPLQGYVGPDYPRWTHRLNDGREVLIRPLGRQDASAERAFIDGLSAKSMHNRFFGQISGSDDALIERLTDIDYVNDVALAATVSEDGNETIVGVSRYSKAPVGERCESAVVVADAWQNLGLGTALMKHLIAIAQDRGLRTMQSTDLAGNLEMHELAKDLGFDARSDPDDAQMVIYTLDLAAAH
jgi:GNAT superfamily N-acetyltransferase